MSAPKHIPRPTLSSATPLRAPELNNIRFSDKHTPLTPEILEKAARSLAASPVKTAPKPPSGAGAEITLS